MMSRATGGQWGAQVRYRPITDLELSLFHVVYHDKNPATALVGWDPIPAGPGGLAYKANGYRVKYFEDIKLTGISATTKIGEYQLGAEWSYRDGAPVMVNTGLGPVPAKGKGQQFQLSAMRILGDRPWASQTTLTGEFVTVRADHADETSAAPNLEGWACCRRWCLPCNRPISTPTKLPRLGVPAPQAHTPWVPRSVTRACSRAGTWKCRSPFPTCSVVRRRCQEPLPVWQGIAA